jgi:dolichol-phosphate mannosyltransferase
MMRAMVILIGFVQVVLAGRVAIRMARTARGTRVAACPADPGADEAVTVLVPVLNEALRLEPCLEGLIAQGPEVREILVIDGGSEDGTQALIARFAERDSRVRLVDAAPVPTLLNGKAHGLAVGLKQADADNGWILTIDADVRPCPLLARSLIAHARDQLVKALSVATQQHLSGAGEGLVHPSMLATLVYRFGIPGGATDRVDQVQANGQCFLVRREVLESVGGFDGVTASICEDVSLARKIAAAGHPVGFYESDGLVSVEMYQGWRDAWTNWSRSLPMMDGQATWWSRVGLAEVVLVQALPLFQTAASLWLVGGRHPVTQISLGLVMMRIGVLAGMSRAYEHRPWTYWASPLVDMPVAIRLMTMAMRKRHTWRGRALANGGTK